ncbi:hypothetical protein MNB_SV-13-1981 [hydrothermal vent metagenome]|uniref:Uncharacterized protein n=1 Tax=hydrothermal vent metagenome TaxID=652676 RepID=A0A1W1CX88_9ZZZZ
MVGYVGSMAKSVDSISSERGNISQKIDLMSNNMKNIN